LFDQLVSEKRKQKKTEFLIFFLSITKRPEYFKKAKVVSFEYYSGIQLTVVSLAEFLHVQPPLVDVALAAFFSWVGKRSGRIQIRHDM
jgi:hypothetical protein